MFLQKYSPPGEEHCPNSPEFTLVGGREGGGGSPTLSLTHSSKDTSAFRNIRGKAESSKTPLSRYKSRRLKETKCSLRATGRGSSAVIGAEEKLWRPVFYTKRNSFKSLAINCGSRTIAHCLILSLRIELCSHTVPHPQILQ